MGKRNGHWLTWTLLGAAGALYAVGRAQRAKTRIPALSGIEAPATVEVYQRITRLPWFHALQQAVITRALRGEHPARILDVGCGSGELTLALARRSKARDVVGLDLADEQIRLARAASEAQGVNARFLVGDAAEMPFPDDSFDLVISTLSLHHWAKPRAGLAEIHRVLAPGGRLVLLDLRRDAPTMLIGAMYLTTQYLVSPAIRETGEPLASFHAAFLPTELVLLAARAGWPDPRVETGPFWMILEAEKAI